MTLELNLTKFLMTLSLAIVKKQQKNAIWFNFGFVWYRYRNSTLVSVPDTDTEFRSDTRLYPKHYYSPPLGFLDLPTALHHDYNSPGSLGWPWKATESKFFKAKNVDSVCTRNTQKDGKDEKSCDLQLMHFIKNGLVSHLKARRPRPPSYKGCVRVKDTCVRV